jgi:hypothetical protein
MDPARENDGLSEREKLENEAMKDGGGESETRRWPKDPWSDVTERELKERNNNDAYKQNNYANSLRCASSLRCDDGCFID